MLRHRNLFCLLIPILGAPVVANETGQLRVEFETPVASVTPRTTDRPIILPSLTYVLRAEANCPQLQTAESVSISIADTRITISPSESKSEAESVEETIRISNKQLGPIGVGSFCRADSDSDADPDTRNLLQIEGALTAHMSLRCVGENSETISYSTAPLGVTLQCDAAKPEEND